MLQQPPEFKLPVSREEYDREYEKEKPLPEPQPEDEPEQLTLPLSEILGY